MIDDVKAAGAKVSLAVIGQIVAAITLSQIATSLTIIYLILQTAHLIYIWRKEHKKE